MTRIPSLENCEAAKTALENVAVNVQDAVELDDVAMALAEMVEVKRLAGRVYDAIEQQYLGLCLVRGLIAFASGRPRRARMREVPGVGAVEVKRSTKRSQWQWDDLIAHIVARALDERKVDEETGEIEREGPVVARAMRDCLSFSAGKVTGLRARGIQPDEFCVEEFNGFDVKLSVPERVEPVVPGEATETAA